MESTYTYYRWKEVDVVNTNNLSLKILQREWMTLSYPLLCLIKWTNEKVEVLLQDLIISSIPLIHNIDNQWKNT